MTTFFRSLPVLALAAWIVYGLWRLFEGGMKERLSPTIRLYGRLIPAFLLILPTPWLKPAGNRFPIFRLFLPRRCFRLPL